MSFKTAINSLDKVKEKLSNKERRLVEDVISVLSRKQNRVLNVKQIKHEKRIQEIIEAIILINKNRTNNSSVLTNVECFCDYDENKYSKFFPKHGEYKIKENNLIELFNLLKNDFETFKRVTLNIQFDLKLIDNDIDIEASIYLNKGSNKEIFEDHLQYFNVRHKQVDYCFKYNYLNLIKILSTKKEIPLLKIIELIFNNTNIIIGRIKK